MLPKKNRVDKKAVEKIFSVGKFVNSTNISLKFFTTPKGKELPKISFIVPKSVSKKAITRNLMRRRGYAVIKKYMNDIPLGFVGVFVFNKKSGNLFEIKKTGDKNPVFLLENEIKTILYEKVCLTTH